MKCVLKKILQRPGSNVLLNIRTNVLAPAVNKSQSY